MYFLDPSLLDESKPFTLRQAATALKTLEEHLNERLIGMQHLVRRLIQTVIMDEHCLIEGAPGLAKTHAVKLLSRQLELTFRRIQFVPDLMPSDLIHRERLEINSVGKAIIQWMPGPVFTNLLLADEINRASPKAQAALLEVTEERQVSTLYGEHKVVRPWSTAVSEGEVTLLSQHGPFYGELPIDGETRHGQQFTVLATMNPIEQEGVYPLSEAQLDRFAFKVIVDYPKHADLHEIAREAFVRPSTTGTSSQDENRNHVKSLYFLTQLRQHLFGPEMLEMWMGSGNDRHESATTEHRAFHHLREQIYDLIDFTHLRSTAMSASEWGSGVEMQADAKKSDELKCLLARREKDSADSSPSPTGPASYWKQKLSSPDYPEVMTGSSPRGLLKLIRATLVEALLSEHFVGEQLVPVWPDVENVATDILRHRIRLTPTSIAAGHRPEHVVESLCQWIRNKYS